MTEERDKDMPNYPSQKIVTVCDKCLTESCWQGRFMCAEAQTAGTITGTEAKIAQMVPSEVELAVECAGETGGIK